MGLCKSCGADIVWGVTQAGKRMPVDPAPVPRGNVTVWEMGGTTRVTVLGGTRLELARAEQQELHLSHFVTCPNADSHRKGDE